MDLVSLLKIVVNRLEKAGIPYMITGGFALNFWGHPRTTHDIDIVIEAKKEDKEKIINLFKDDFYVSKEAVEDAIEHQFTFNILHLKSGAKVDVWLVKKDPFRILEFKRKLKKKFFNKEFFIISPEDLILSKLLWYKEGESSRQLEDIKSILQTSKINLNYIKSWAEKQSTIEILNKVIKE